MDDIEKRLRDAADNCIKHFSAWQKDKKMGSDRDSLMEAIHELRKVAARLEIDIAVSERTEMGARPLPIPPHRSSGRRGQGDDNIGNEAPEDSFGNQQPEDPGHQQPRSNAGRDPRRPGGHSGGPRRQGGGGGGGRPQG